MGQVRADFAALCAADPIRGILVIEPARGARLDDAKERTDLAFLVQIMARRWLGEPYPEA